MSTEMSSVTRSNGRKLKGGHVSVSLRRFGAKAHCRTQYHEEDHPEKQNPESLQTSIMKKKELTFHSVASTILTSVTCLS